MKLIGLFMAMALIQLPVWAGLNHGATSLIAILLLIMLANVYVPSWPMPARHRH